MRPRCAVPGLHHPPPEPTPGRGGGCRVLFPAAIAIQVVVGREAPARLPLASGALLEWTEGTLNTNEHMLCRKLFHLFEKGDVFLADRGFCSYALIGTMLNKGVDCVIRLNAVRKTDWRRGS